MIKKRYIIAGAFFILLIFLPGIYRMIYPEQFKPSAECKSENCSGGKIAEEKNIQEQEQELALGDFGEGEVEEDKNYATPKSIVGMDPVEAYLLIRNEFFKVEDFNGLVSFSENYGSYKNNIAVGNMESMNGVIDDEFIISMIMSSVPSEISETEIISSNDKECIIKVVSENNKEGEVRMVFEEGVWKLDYEEWGN